MARFGRDHRDRRAVSGKPDGGDAQFRPSALPEAGVNVAWWVRLKGVRDVVSGVLLLALLTWGGTRVAGIALLVQAMIPLGDMSLILAARGSAARALGIHGLTAALMIAAAVPWIMGM